MKYDSSFCKTTRGKKLKNAWKTVRKAGCCERWNNFDNFCDDVIGLLCEDALFAYRMDRTKPFSPNNFGWSKKKSKSNKLQAVSFEERWNSTVNMSRKHYGMGRVEDMNVNRCVCCGTIIPEGRQVCPSCIAAVNEEQRREDLEEQ